MHSEPDIYDGPAYVVGQKRIAPNGWKMTVAAPVPARVAAGRFVHLLVDEDRKEFRLRRPFSFWDVRHPEGAWTNFDLVYQVVGPGTERMTRKEPLDTVGFLGPLGRGFTPPADGERLIFVAGGVGIVPFHHFARQLREEGRRHEILLLFGARNRDLLYGIDEFADVDVKALAATEDGSRGDRGLVTDLLLRHLDGGPVRIYTCGPDRMIERVARIARERKLPCEVSMEQRMGCGLGACGACVTKVADGDDWRYSRVCREGPAYDASALVLE